MGFPVVYTGVPRGWLALFVRPLMSSRWDLARGLKNIAYPSPLPLSGIPFIAPTPFAPLLLSPRVGMGNMGERGIYSSSFQKYSWGQGWNEIWNAMWSKFHDLRFPEKRKHENREETKRFTPFSVFSTRSVLIHLPFQTPYPDRLPNPVLPIFAPHSDTAIQQSV